jgi:hypothetical protein
MAKKKRREGEPLQIESSYLYQGEIASIRGKVVRVLRLSRVGAFVKPSVGTAQQLKKGFWVQDVDLH